MRFKVSWQFKDTSPKNVAVISPCFRRQLDITDPTSGADAQQLCQDLATAINSAVPRTTPLRITAYNIEGPPPHYPMGAYTLNGASTPIDPGMIPEAAVVLSYYAGQNVKRQRGRVYIPAWVVASGASSLLTAVPSGVRTTAATFVTSFANLGGTNVDWGVWSSRDAAFHKATNYFISDAWGTVRSRGIKETARTTGTTSG